MDQVIERYPRFVLATGGSLVSEPATFEQLLTMCFTVWLRATPEEQKVESRSVRAPPRAARRALFGPSTTPVLPPDACRWPSFVRKTVRLLSLITQKGCFGLCDARAHAYTLI